VTISPFAAQPAGVLGVQATAQTAPASTPTITIPPFAQPSSSVAGSLVTSKPADASTDNPGSLLSMFANSWSAWSASVS
jgi:hypothetical protein